MRKFKLFVSFLLLLLARTASSTPLNVNITGIDPANTDLLLNFDFIDGDGPSNSVSLTNITSDGQVSFWGAQGGVTSASGGNYLFNDSEFYNNLQLQLEGSSQIHFYLDATNIPSTGFPDNFVISLLSKSFGFPLNSTDEPLGTNALISWNISDETTSSLSVFNPIDGGSLNWSAEFKDAPPVVVSLPEPNSLLMLIPGLFGLLLSRKFRKGK